VVDRQLKEAVDCLIRRSTRSQRRVDEFSGYDSAEPVGAQQEPVARAKISDGQIGRPAFGSSVEVSGNAFG
jgi:hypothetical protein